MSLFERVNSFASICGIEVSLRGSFDPVAMKGYHEFYNSRAHAVKYETMYYGKASVSFSEESEESAAGTSFKQTLSIRFPATDDMRAYRLARLHKVRFIKIKLSDDKDLIMGRNDFEQNARPQIQSKSTEHLAEVQFTTVSIAPSGFAVFEQPLIYPNIFPIIINNTEENE
ncbi:hypothetical protein [Flavobacterium psychrotrophum]|uniref:hypothetical protein n=1 Tax=Flavobacterium psychrotrophum TaxID=2294119 RepID=UPI000E30B57B|nr:hypothetical protein [Flavobacterium psychrotrophum]